MSNSVDALFSTLEKFMPQIASGGFSDDVMAEISTHLLSFVSTNEKVFEFKSGKVSNLVRLLLSNLKGCLSVHSDYKLALSTYHLIHSHLQVIRILSRDLSVVDVIEKDDYRFLVQFATNTQDDTDEDDLNGVRQKVAEEALKCFCNLAYHCQRIRNYLIEHRFSRDLLNALAKRSKTRQFLNLDVFIVRILFLLSALDLNERETIRTEYRGMAVLCDVLTVVVSNEVVTDECSGTSTEHTSSGLVLSPFNSKLACEILKALFNISVGISDVKVLDERDIEDCSRLMKELHYLFENHSLDRAHSDQVFTHALNLVLNMPKECFSSFIPLLNDRKETRTIVSQTFRYPVEFRKYNMASVASLLQGLEERLKLEGRSERLELLPPMLSCFSYVCRLCRVIRKYVRFQVLPPLKDATKRPEESTDLRGMLVKLMTDIDSSIKYLAADFLFVLCKENVDRLVKHTGYGNAAGFLASRGLMLGRNAEFTGDYSSSDDDSETEEYKDIEDQVDPITGAIRREDEENPLQGMTEEEKEQEAEKLIHLIGQLSDMKVIQPMKAGEDGRPVELEEEEIQDIMRKMLDNQKTK